MKKLLLYLLMFSSAIAVAQEVAPQQILKSEGGRYVFGQAAAGQGASKELWMLDTKTGRLWVLANTKSGWMLAPVKYAVNNGGSASEPPTPEQETEITAGSANSKPAQKELPSRSKVSASEFLDAAGFPAKPSTPASKPITPAPR